MTLMAITSNFALMEELDHINKEYDHKDDFLGTDILTLTNKVDSVRGSMLASMLQQTVCVANSEPPRVFTRYENQVGKYSSSYYRNDDTQYAELGYSGKKIILHDKKIIAMIPKFSFSNNYVTYVVQDVKTREYSIIEKKIGEKLTESYCYLYDTSKIDSYKEGDTIPANEVLYSSTNFDEDMNYGYGINVPACYMINNNTIEDAVEISDELADYMAHYYMHEVEVNINTNDLLVNLYGDRKNYKSFPDIGEDTMGKVLIARRRINYNNALFDLKDEQLMHINYNSDRIFYAKGTIIDIDIFSNTNIEELMSAKYNEQIVKYLKEQKKYYDTVKSVLHKIVDGDKKCTADLKYLYRRACDITNPDIIFRNDKTDFDHIVIKFKVLERVPLHIGSKIAGRYGRMCIIYSL